MAAGPAITEEPVVELNPVAGFHVNVAAPLAVKVVLLPEHIAGVVGVTVTTNDATTDTVTVCVPEHPAADVPVTVYVVVVAG